MSRPKDPTSESLLSEFNGVSKWYGPVIGVNDVSFHLGAGITGLVGPNGAGKSTLIKLLTGQLRPSLGDVTICGKHAWSAKAKSHVGCCPDVDAFYEEMSGRAFVRAMARLHGFYGDELHARTQQVLVQVNMADDRADRRLHTYSKGMRQRIKLAQALVHDPEMIVLDEPLNGVNPLGRNELIRLFRRLADDGKAVLISSHILDEMDTLTDRILFIFRGRIIASGTLEQIRDMLDDHPLRVRISADEPRKLAARLLALPSVQGAELNEGGDIFLKVHHPIDFFPAFCGLAAENGAEVNRLEVIDQSTEAIFDYLMKKSRHP